MLHQEWHTEHEKSVKCSYCTKPFSSLAELEAHSCVKNSKPNNNNPEMEKTKGVKRKSDKLETINCKKSFSFHSFIRKYADISELIQHPRTHEKSSSNCSNCNKTFTNTSELLTHRCVTIKNPSDYLKKSEISEDQPNVVVREPRLNSEYPFECSKCLKTFTSAPELFSHEQSHTFRCHKCPEKFHRRSDLIQHQLDAYWR